LLVVFFVRKLFFLVKVFLVYSAAKSRKFTKFQIPSFDTTLRSATALHNTIINVPGANW
jgi:hypothetical protein